MFEKRPVLFFDSGIGGLSVLREARLFLPGHRFLYIMDNAGFPYGAREEGALRRRIVALFSGWLERYNPALCVLACNTASTLSLAPLRAAFPDYMFVGTVPAIKPAAQHSASKLISVLATPGTVKRDYTQELIAKYAGQCRVNLVGSACLAAMAEDYMRGRAVDLAAMRAEVAPCFIEENGKRTDIVVLACTHYPFLTPLLRSLAPWPVDWPDSAEAIARRAAALLAKGKEPAGGAEEARKAKEREKPQAADYALCTDSRAADFTAARLFHAFGLRLKKTPA